MEARPSRLRSGTKIGLSLLGLILLMPIIGIVWLHINHITITDLKGLRYNNGLHAEHVSLRIFSYNVTFHQLALQHQTDPDNDLDEGSYRLFAKKYEIELSPAATAILEKQQLYLRYIHFFDTTFRFVDFKYPLAINANARKVTTSATHSDGKEATATQILEQVDVTISHNPHLVISGHSSNGKLTLFFPHTQPSPHYPLLYNNSQFSIAWLDNKTPVTVTIASIHPQWKTLNNTLAKQIISQLSLTFDLNRSLPTMVLAAGTIKLEQPKYLPTFINRTDIDSKGIHLGQAIANLARLPIKKLKVNALTYGDLLIDAKVILETPTATASSTMANLATAANINHSTITFDKPPAVISENKQQRQRRKQARQKIDQQAKDLNIATEKKTKARFIVKGKALSPHPYLLDVNIYHLSKTDARAHTIMTRSDGNNLNCDIKVIFHQPLPHYLNCNANFKNTKEFTDRLGFENVPDAKINGPLRFYAKQIVSDLSKATHPMVINNKIVDAHYLIGIELPSSFTIELNKYAFEAPFFTSKDKTSRHHKASKHVTNIEMNSDGKINFNISYHSKLFSIALSDKNETIRFNSAKTKSNLQLLVDEFNCLYPNLQCHLNAKINASINTLRPVVDSQVDDIIFRSNIKATWANNYLISQLQHTHLQTKKLTFEGIPTLASNKIDDIDFSLNQLIGLFEKKQDRIALTLYQPQKTQAQLTAKLATRHQTQKTLPITDYKAQLHIDVSQFLLHHEFLFEKTPLNDNLLKNRSIKNTLQPPPATPLTFSSHYKITIDAAQRNHKQLFPLSTLYGQLHLEGKKLNIRSTLTNRHDDVLAKVDIDADLTTKKTHVKLHRQAIAFTPANSLKNYYFPALALPIDITDGKITYGASFIIDRNNHITGNATVATDRLSGSYYGINITQLESSANIAFSPQGIQTLHPISLFAQQLHAGIILTNPSLLIDVNTQTNQYTLHRISASLLGGNISAHNINLSNLQKLAPIPITVFGLNIKQVTDLIDHEGIEFTGILDGTIPITMVDGHFRIHHATLHSRYPGGVLRYIAGSVIDEKIKAVGHQSPLMVSEILKNYHYRTLAIKVNYAKDGMLKTQSHFKGYNPDFQSGRPININLAIEDNILELIRTINMLNASNVEKKISEHFTPP